MPSVGSSPCRPEPPKAPFGKRPLPPFITTVDVPPRGADSGVSEKPSESGESVARDILVLDPDMFNEGVRADVDPRHRLLGRVSRGVCLSATRSCARTCCVAAPSKVCGIYLECTALARMHL